MTYPGRMFSEKDPGFDSHGIGAMCWSFDEDGTRVLWFIAPRVPPIPGRQRQQEYARLYTTRDDKLWRKGGPIKGWDGNEERPTFTPSIWLNDKKGWHGFIRAGNLSDA